MAELTCDVAIIGAGTAGLAAERAARGNGAKTLLIDESFAGTTCTNVGCMPSKLLIAAGNAAHAARRAELFGVTATPLVDGAAVLKRLRKERDKFIAGVLDSVKKLPEDIKLKAHARFDGAARLALDNGDTVSARAIVIAAGSAPAIPGFLKDVREAVLTNETLFDLADLPASVGVIGAGALGLELAQALSRLGVEVAVFDTGDRLAGLDDERMAACFHAILAREFPVHLGIELEVAPSGELVEFRWKGPGSGSASFERILVAAGRPPRLDGLGLDTTGLKLDDHGAPKVDPYTMQCGSAPIFIAGDADHIRPVLHEAQAEGAIAGRNAARFPAVAAGKRMTGLSIIFTEPAVARVGHLPQQDDPAFVCGSASYEDQGRAKIFATNVGRVQLYAEAGQGRLVGAIMVGPAVEHTAHLLAWAIQQELTATAVLDMPFYHPTYEEGLKPALRAICAATHSEASPDRDDGFMPGA